MVEDSIEIRLESPDDRDAIYEVNQRAFGREGEAQLVDTLRDAGVPLISLIADDGGQIVGHILFSPVTVRGSAGEWSAIALGPMAVLPEKQQRGIGTILVETGLDACYAAGHDIIFVLGHPTYYPRFGFVPSQPLGVTCEFDVPPEVFMVRLAAGATLAGRGGVVYYHPAFHTV